jgi:hypothetical protein
MTDVKTINFKGKPYVMVAERLRQLYDQKHDLEVLDSTFAEIGGRVLCKVTILVDGKKFTGNAEAKLLNAAPKSADETNPLECAETSALGRALAFANFGTVDGIASLDELARSMTPDQIRDAMQSNQRSAPATNGTGQAPQPEISTPHPINATQLESIQKLYKRVGRDAPADIRAWDYIKAKSVYEALGAEVKRLQPAT